MILGVRALPLFAPSGALPRPLTPHRLQGKRCPSGAGRFLKVLRGASLSPIRRTEKTKPAEFQRVLLVYSRPLNETKHRIIVGFYIKRTVPFLPFTLSVVFNQVFHELGVAKVDGACVVLVQSGDLGHLVGCKREVEDVEVLLHALLVA